MGNFQVRRIRNAQDQNRFYNRILKDLEAFDQMLSSNLIEKRDDRIGAEQELCIIDQSGQPSMRAEELLSRISDPHFTYELALYNLELNLDPVSLAPDGLAKMASELERYLDLGSRIANAHDTHLYLAGVLPTIQARHLQIDHMTPLERYKVLNDFLLDLRGSDFEIYLQGVDDFNVTLDSDLFEACNTSFQCHLQINPDHFVQQYNWAQMISGPLLSCCTNAPLVFGRELWSESRIGLFKQSLDTRTRKDFTRINLSRVNFGNDWIYNSPADLWRNAVTHFPILFQSDNQEDSLACLENGKMPTLHALQLHNGTTYTWNRLCYGVHENTAHVRIECRYLPAGPSMTDQIANFAFWVGLMKGKPSELDNFWRQVDFRIAKDNFIRAARTGINSVFSWFGDKISAPELILGTLLPMAASGLKDEGVSDPIIDKYLSIIKARVETRQTGSEWLIYNSRKLRTRFKPAMFNKMLVLESLRNQQLNIPVHEWPEIKLSDGSKTKIQHVEHLMNSGVRAIGEDVSIAVAKQIMSWEKIHHLPIENVRKEIIGLLCWEDIMTEDPDSLVRDLMRSSPVSIQPNASLTDAKELMQRYEQQALVVMEEDRLAGIITTTDLFDPALS